MFKGSAVRIITTLALLAFSAEAVAGAASLKQRADAFSGMVVALDPRLPVPACPDGIGIAWRSDARTSLVAQCVATGWTLVIPVASAKAAAAGRAPTIVRRGQPVQVVTTGRGFRVSAEGVAERGGRAGERVVVRNLRSGRRMAADIGADGAMTLAHSEAPWDRP